MPDLTKTIIEEIQSRRLQDFEQRGNWILPAYDGLSILNLPGSLSAWFEAEPAPHPSIKIPALDDYATGAKQVICVLIDAVALHRFQNWISQPGSKLSPWVKKGLMATLTSIVPSTTSAALTTLWTGRSPAEHGILGYEIFLKEFGLIANMITHAPAIYDGRAGLLYSAGFDPEEFLPVETLGPKWTEAGVDVHAFLHYSISGSGLSRMHYPAVETHSFAHPSDLWIAVRELAQQSIASKRMIWVYFGGVDGLSHRFGPDSEQAEAVFHEFTNTMVAEFLEKLLPEPADQTLLLLLADHGQLTTQVDPNFELGNHPNLARRLHMLPTGENRLAYLYVKPGQTAAVEEYLQRTWSNAFSGHHSNALLEVGLFGPGEPAASTRDRLGDLTVLTHQDSYLWWAAKPNPLIGRHGGLSSQEMLVPLLAIRPGA
jgi:hypothetical protein